MEMKNEGRRGGAHPYMFRSNVVHSHTLIARLGLSAHKFLPKIEDTIGAAFR